jgi:phosphoglycolate phosphatase-like HAD superfamily hydrolase
VLLHEEVFEDQAFADVCQEVAAAIQLYPDMLALLRRAIETLHTLPIIVTGGPRLVWEIVLKRVGLFETVHVIGSGRHENHAMMTPEVKGLLVAILQEKFNADVWAFGRNLVDAVMFLKADQAVHHRFRDLAHS